LIERSWVWAKHVSARINGTSIIAKPGKLLPAVSE
jgi:hypothetical protein